MKLAWIGKITEINKIKKADFIVSATVVCGEGGKWMGTVKKDQFNVGDLCEVYLQDSLLPHTEEFAFMEAYKYRVSMRRFKKVPSECLIMPMSMNVTKYGVVGTNISESKGVMKYNKPIAANLSGIALGSFPTRVVPKTDEPNFQTARDIVDMIKGMRYYSTVKADGSSGTIYKNDDHFGCCSRNLELKETDGNLIWELAHQYDLQNVLTNKYAIQFEIVGPGIQKNPMGFDKVDMRVFNLWDIKRRVYADAEIMFGFCERAKLPTVEVIDWNKVFTFQTDEELRKYAEGKYKESGKQREGVVFRPMKEGRVNGDRLSFKVINLLFKD